MDSTLIEFCGFLGDALPETESLACFVSIGEEDDPSVAKWGEKACVEHRLAAAGEPSVIGEEL